MEETLENYKQGLVDYENEKAEIKSQIKEYEEQIKSIEDEKKEILKTILDNDTILKLKKPESKVYKITKKESEDCIKEAQKKQREIEELKHKIEMRHEDMDKAESSFITYLQTMQTKAKEQIEQAEKRIQAIKSERAPIKDNIMTNKAVLKIAKPTHSVYKVAKQENRGLIAKLRKGNQEIKSLTEKINIYKQEVEEINTILSELIKVRTEREIKKQEEMWDKYKAEQEEQERKDKADIHEKLDTYTKNQKSIKEKEDAEARQNAEKEIEWYVKKELEQEAEEINEGTESTNENNHGNTDQSGINNGIVNSGNPPKKEENVSIKNIVFAIQDNIPTYTITLVDIHGREVEYKKSGFENLQKMKGSEKRELARQGINVKYYDNSLANILSEVDKTYNTSGLKKYQRMQKDNNYLNGTNRRSELNIQYNFSNLYEMPSKLEDRNKIRRLEKIAKNDRKVYLATYLKRPNRKERSIRKKEIKMLLSINPVRSEDIEKTTSRFARKRQEFVQKNEMNPILKSYIEQSRDGAIDLKDFISEIKSEKEYTSDEVRVGMIEIIDYIERSSETEKREYTREKENIKQ